MNVNIKKVPCTDTDYQQYHCSLSVSKAFHPKGVEKKESGSLQVMKNNKSSARDSALVEQKQQHCKTRFRTQNGNKIDPVGF